MKTPKNCTNSSNMPIQNQVKKLLFLDLRGRFPESQNMKELKNNIFNCKDCITENECHWKLGNSEIPKHLCKIKNVEKFDASFFGIHFNQAYLMDPMSRMMLEHAYEAIIDAGINPDDIRGTRTGVFVNSCFSDSEPTLLHSKLQADVFGITNCSRDMMAQNISYWLGVAGPSYNVDTGCSSTLYAMDQAYRFIRSGDCDYAIVSGSNLCLHPYTSLHFVRLSRVLNQDGRCKIFDEDANECVSSVSNTQITDRIQLNPKWMCTLFSAVIS
uniref:fatty acid synthase-like n=1 Tax=Vespula vulgaris TaxID=7454 RepID=UPI00223C4C64|nr:fatty acid synthase-like [Vespula vulgaris]